jgi:peptidoglycan-N-acetylglucosamine deacetylase
MIPHRTPFFLPLLFPPTLLWRIATSQRELYLTFDDGPIPSITDFVLDTLAKYSLKATFFCIGDNITKYPSVFKRIIREEHSVGNHTFNHLNGWKTKADQYFANVEECEICMRDHSNGKFQGSLFRPPYGRITRQQIARLDNYKIIMWDVLSLDYNKSLRTEKCLKNSIAATRPGSIVVFHDSLKAERNLVYTLPRYIEHFLESGFVFKSL